ncbi:MAG TPA: hypothetical protein VN773_14055 [Verrucomicrobiae bacterium]|jgi:hypothetical protein|nr:hypothetical protein [Verrucomicrobiae bacterium]
MDASPVIVFPRPGGDAAASDVVSSALTEIDVAIALVASHAARRVRLTAIPFVEDAAALGLAHARAAGIAFTFERGERLGVATVTVGPLE